eukprot:2243382-Pyramimonas_sp.AAC.1
MLYDFGASGGPLRAPGVVDPGRNAAQAGPREGPGDRPAGPRGCAPAAPPRALRAPGGRGRQGRPAPLH